MKIIYFRAKNIKITEYIERYVEKKFGHLERYTAKMKNPHDIGLELGRSTKHHQKGPYFFAKINVNIPRAQLHAEAEGESVFEALDFLHDEIEKELKKFSGKIIAKKKKGGQKAKKMLDYDPASLTPKEKEELE